ncbi:MAG: SDR family NAD(P)-dependent oxidoreductase [Alphaproteobacteria bacterium]
MAEQAKPGVVVTGGAGDMGRLTAASFAADGFTVYAGDVKPVAGGKNIVPVDLDVTDRAAVFALARRAAEETALRVWVNCAGIVGTASIEAADEAMWQRIIDINLSGTFHGCAAAFESMSKPPAGRAPGGRIVNAGSISGQLGGVGPHPAYGASKAGVHALTKSYAIAGARYGIYCNAIAPSVIEGSMGQGFSGKQREKLLATIPLRRLAEMDEIVHAIRYLADPKASYTTGVILQLNGGTLSIG